MTPLRNTRARQAAAFAAACLAAAALPARAVTPHRLTITGDRAGFVDVRLSKDNRFDLSRATFSGGTSYTGVLISRVGPPSAEDSLLGIQFPVADYDPPKPVVLGHVQYGDGGSALSPGTYRIYLLADGPATVSFPASALRRDVTLRATRRVTPRLRVTDIPTPLAPGVNGLYQGLARHPFAMDGQSMVVYRLAATFEPAAADRRGADLCDTQRGATCSMLGDGPTSTGVRIEKPERAVGTGYVPRDLWPSGTYDVYGSCYATQPVPACRLVTLDRFVSAAPPLVVLQLPEAPSGAPPRSSTGHEGGQLPSSGVPTALPTVAALLATAAFALRVRRLAVTA